MSISVSSMGTNVVFLGSAAAVPEASRESASFLINGKYMVDMGWCAVLRLIKLGFDPLKIEYVFITHCHHDHYMGLPQFLFYNAMEGRQGKRITALKLVGTSDLPLIVELAKSFLQAEKFPEVNPEANLEVRVFMPGDILEEDEFILEACESRHPVDARCYKFTDKRTNLVVAFTGDTLYHEPIADFVKGADLLIHEASFPPDTKRESLEKSGHSIASDAAKIARLAEVKQLTLIHYKEKNIDDSLQIARSIFPDTELAREGYRWDVAERRWSKL